MEGMNQRGMGMDRMDQQTSPGQARMGMDRMNQQSNLGMGGRDMDMESINTNRIRSDEELLKIMEENRLRGVSSYAIGSSSHLDEDRNQGMSSLAMDRQDSMEPQGRSSEEFRGMSNQQMQQQLAMRETQLQMMNNLLQNQSTPNSNNLPISQGMNQGMMGSGGTGGMMQASGQMMMQGMGGGGMQQGLLGTGGPQGMNRNVGGIGQKNIPSLFDVPTSGRKPGILGKRGIERGQDRGRQGMANKRMRPNQSPQQVCLSRLNCINLFIILYLPVMLIIYCKTKNIHPTLFSPTHEEPAGFEFPQVQYRLYILYKNVYLPLMSYLLNYLNN